jgi:hypothetical protein
VRKRKERLYMDGNPANQKLSAVCFKRTMRMEGKLCGSGTYET